MAHVIICLSWPNHALLSRHIEARIMSFILGFMSHSCIIKMLAGKVPEVKIADRQQADCGLNNL